MTLYLSRHFSCVFLFVWLWDAQIFCYLRVFRKFTSNSQFLRKILRSLVLLLLESCLCITNKQFSLLWIAMAVCSRAILLFIFMFFKFYFWCIFVLFFYVHSHYSKFLCPHSSIIMSIHLICCCTIYIVQRFTIIIALNFTFICNTSLRINCLQQSITYIYLITNKWCKEKCENNADTHEVKLHSIHFIILNWSINYTQLITLN